MRLRPDSLSLVLINKPQHGLVKQPLGALVTAPHQSVTDGAVSPDAWLGLHRHSPVPTIAPRPPGHLRMNLLWERQAQIPAWAGTMHSTPRGSVSAVGYWSY